eukprot:CAMPEP_0113543518 /NCGR_PEP_ID=MMETSP0015_2-20120614/10201_1 /TAXON_ID=2838 /ORGANISM="Odontella" /LENGTH=580 /DNA_ID=CAMNT_0000443683 /DNA_START=62 /DNA_END=1804 /DNA_ORIENTATION=- /assembly_acc=CAM_ASM_000160
MRRYAVAAFLAVAGGCAVAVAFSPTPKCAVPILRSKLSRAIAPGVLPAHGGLSTALPSLPTALSTAASSISRAILPPSTSSLSKVIRLFVLILASAMTISSTLRNRILYPGIVSDASRSEPLPPGPRGCPFIGKPFFVGSKSFGSGDFYRRISAKLGNPRIWKYYFMGQPFAVLSGKELKYVLNKEFDEVTSSGVDLMGGGLMPMKSLLFERDRARHSFLRRLVGKSMTSSKVSEAVPTLQVAAEVQVSKMLKGGPDKKVAMAKICNDYTLDVAWRQILGLDLPEDEIPKFEHAVEQWATGIMTIRILFRVAVKSSPGYRAMKFVEEKIKNKISQLERDGPDSSTLSGMLFATDDEDVSRKLTREETIDNALILIFAGSETSASTLTNSLLFLGLHPDAWDKLVDEQLKMKERHGDMLTKQNLDDECPYLEAVIKESMRMRAISGGIPRKAIKTLVVDGKQIPEGWLIDPSPLLTHELDPKTSEEAGAHVDAVTGFNPERWLKEETKPSEDYMPFGAGPRFCLGYNLALAEMKVFLAVLARKISYSLDKKENIEWKGGMSVIAKPADGVLVRVTAAGEET